MGDRMKRQVMHDVSRLPEWLSSVVAGAVIGLVVALMVCRFVQADSDRHFDAHLRALELRWNASHPRCWP